MKRMYGILVLIMVMVFAALPASATPTRITVRVKAKDAKFVGTSLGGALVTIKDVRTGELLAKGRTAGGTGNTVKIMDTPAMRGVPLSGEGDAQFTATIDIDEPTEVEVSAYGPLAQTQSANRVSATQWVLPGKDITQGDGWLLELPGFVVDVLAPPAHTFLRGTPQIVTLKANVTMMCGCPITPGGLWDAGKYEVAALLSKNGQRIGVLPLQYVGPASQFAAIWTVSEPGVYEATVYAYDAANGNTGLDRVTFMVSP